MQSRRVRMATYRAGHGEQHTITVATTVVCGSDRSPTVDRDEQHLTATTAAVGTADHHPGTASRQIPRSNPSDELREL
jgi:hypothetical protein